MTSKEIYTVGDLINFLLQFDPQKRVMLYDSEAREDTPLYIVDENEKIVMVSLHY